MKITRFQELKYAKRLKELKDAEEKLAIDVEVATAQGDLSENSSYDDALQAMTSNKLEQVDIIQILSSAEVVPYDTSPLIVEGSLIEISGVNFPRKIYMLSGAGNLILDGVIRTDSPIGMAILGNVSGNFKVGNEVYTVNKITKPNITAFNDEYPSNEEVLDRYFDLSVVNNPNKDNNNLEVLSGMITSAFKEPNNIESNQGDVIDVQSIPSDLENE